MEYVFFDGELQARFTRRLAELEILWQEKPDKLFGNIVSITDDLSDAITDELEILYDVLFDEQAVLAEHRDGWVNKHLAGVQATLPDGRECTIALPPDLANKLMLNFSANEIVELVSAVAVSLNQDYNGPLCKHPLGKKAVM